MGQLSIPRTMERWFGFGNGGLVSGAVDAQSRRSRLVDKPWRRASGEKREVEMCGRTQIFHLAGSVGLQSLKASAARWRLKLSNETAALSRQTRLCTESHARIHSKFGFRRAMSHLRAARALIISLETPSVEM